MIIPLYHKAESKAVYPLDVIGKWSCSYFEERDNVRVCRYLHPSGWKRFCYYWSSFKEMEETFNKIGQNRLIISDKELTDERNERREWEQFYNERMRYDEFTKG